MTDISRDNSDSSNNVHAHDGAAVVNLGEMAQGKWPAVMLALSIFMFLMSCWMWRTDATEKALRQYETQQLRVQTDLNQQLQKLILARTCNE